MSQHVTARLLKTSPWNLTGMTVVVRCRLYMLCRGYHYLFDMADPERGPPNTVALLLEWTPSDLLSFPGLNLETVEAIKICLAGHGLELAPEKPASEATQQLFDKAREDACRHPTTTEKNP